METVSPVDARYSMGYESVDAGRRASGLNYSGAIPVESMLHRAPDPDRSHHHSSHYIQPDLPFEAQTANGLFDHSRAASANSAPHLESNSSNVSNATSGETDITSPEPGSVGLASQLLAKATGPDQHPNGKQLMPCSTTPVRPRPVTPRIDAAMGLSSVIPSPTSPMSIDTPALHGQKRTASGMIKESSYAPNGIGSRRSNHARNLSAESGMSRAGELSAQLKARLSYAMVKVQNGWERHTLDELETIAQSRSQRGTPSTPSDNSVTPNTRRRSVFETYALSPGGANGFTPARLPPMSNGISHAHSRSIDAATTASNLRQATGFHFPSSSAPVNSGPTGPSLAPAPEITSSFSTSNGSRHPRRNTTSRVPPSLRGGHTPQSNSDSAAYHRMIANAPQTPTQPGVPPTRNVRGKLLRMPSQQAEKDAVDSLLFMSSPNNSAAFKNKNNRVEEMPTGARGLGLNGVYGAR